MAIHVYECPKGHTKEVIERAVDEHVRYCDKCHQKMALGVGRTGTPVLKRGIGGFHKPTRD